MSNQLAPLLTFKDQFSFVPTINQKENLLSSYTEVVIAGMGGSAISVGLLKLMFPHIPIRLHNGYGAPSDINRATTLVIVNSYSGNTEEALDVFENCRQHQIHLATISKGGELAERARANTIPYIILPDSSLEPRFSIGYQMIGLLSLMGKDVEITTLKEAIPLIDQNKAEHVGKELAERFFRGKYPVLYSSSYLAPVAYLIKAAINEGAKVPSFVSVIPEANHNELQSFVDGNGRNETDFAFLFFASAHDHARVLKRIQIMDSLYQEHGFTTYIVHGDHSSMVCIFELILTGYYMATYMAIDRAVDPYITPLIQEFKKRMAHN